MTAMPARLVMETPLPPPRPGDPPGVPGTKDPELPGTPDPGPPLVPDDPLEPGHPTPQPNPVPGPVPTM
jgi:hypothetical protein